MRRLCLIFLIACAFGCSNTKPGWKTIDMGEYLIDVPDDFNLKIEKGIDSQPGVLKGNNLDLYYDYGPYGDTLVMTKQEFLIKGFWKDEAIIRFLSYKQHPDVDWFTTKVISLRPCVKGDSSFAAGCDLIASCIYKKDKFDLPVYIPQEIKNHVVKIDTIDGYYHRLVFPRKSFKGITGVYMRKAKVDNSPGILHNSIVIRSRRLNDKQQALAIAIIATLRPKPKE
ncbi:MAG: hypothetical protein WC615_21450 [Mucilaginibacter sp.]|uniref:hypothetical protein n=1 Tax=Mucilaginibacter sp. TaxID=1882438 RepID=UPI00356343B1